MKKLFYIVASLFIMLSFNACDDVNSMHDKYLVGGERLYVGKADTFAIYGGRNRAKLVMWVKDQRVKSILISRVDTTLTYEFSYNLFELEDSTVFYVDNLKEGSNILSWQNWNFDKTVSSIADGTSVTVWGDRYQSFLTHRKISSVAYNRLQKVYKLTWDSQNAKEPLLGSFAIGHELKYKTLSANDTVLQVIFPTTIDGIQAESITTIPKYDDKTGKIEYRMLFKPNPTCIDTFYTDYKEYPIAIPAP